MSRKDDAHGRFILKLNGWKVRAYSDGGAGKTRDKRKARAAKQARKANRALSVVAVAALAVPVGAHARPRARVAAVQDGPCVLHSYTPSAQPGGVQAHGRVDTCGGFTGEAHITLQVCLQVQGAGGYGQFTKQETCQTVGPYNAQSIDVRSLIATDAVRGHVYRTWAWARVNDSTNWFTSSWWTY